MAEPFLGEIALLGCNFAPRGWAICAGQLLPISQNTALFSLLGTQYGGDGRTTFRLPDLTGRVAVGQGQGPGLSPYQIGDKLGTENETLTIAHLPAHGHLAQATTASATSTSPTGAVPAVSVRSVYGVGSTTPIDTLDAGAPAQPHSNLQPYLTLNYCIALQGIFPSRQ